jgi:hypothetical protein
MVPRSQLAPTRRYLGDKSYYFGNRCIGTKCKKRCSDVHCPLSTRRCSTYRGCGAWRIDDQDFNEPGSPATPHRGGPSEGTP